MDYTRGKRVRQLFSNLSSSIPFSIRHPLHCILGGLPVRCKMPLLATGAIPRASDSQTYTITIDLLPHLHSLDLDSATSATSPSLPTSLSLFFSPSLLFSVYSARISNKSPPFSSATSTVSRSRACTSRSSVSSYSGGRSTSSSPVIISATALAHSAAFGMPWPV